MQNSHHAVALPKLLISDEGHPSIPCAKNVGSWAVSRSVDTTQTTGETLFGGILLTLTTYGNWQG